MSGHLKPYATYVFVDKDPVIDKLRTIVQDSGETYKAVAERSGVSANTLTNWFNGATKRPQFASTMAVARALGYDLQFVPRRVRRTDSEATVIMQKELTT